VAGVFTQGVETFRQCEELKYDMIVSLRIFINRLYRVFKLGKLGGRYHNIKHRLVDYFRLTTTEVILFYILNKPPKK